jgi:RNA polymerase sigma-70 factor (ECF subfamily)
MMDAAAFNKLVLPMSRKLLHFATQMLHDSAEAEDAVQEAVLKLWKIRDSLEGFNSLEAFAMKITRNWCLDRLKAKRPVYIEGYHSGYDRQTEEGNPQKLMEHADKLSLLFRLLNKLPDQQRQIIQLRDIEGYEFDQIAEIMDMNTNALRVNLSRARNRIREELIKYDKYGYQTNKDSAGKIL